MDRLDGLVLTPPLHPKGGESLCHGMMQTHLQRPSGALDADMDKERGW